MNIIWSHFIVRQTTEDSFIIGVACDKKVGGGGSSLAALQKFTPMPIPIPHPYPWEYPWEFPYPRQPCFTNAQTRQYDAKASNKTITNIQILDAYHPLSVSNSHPQAEVMFANVVVISSAVRRNWVQLHFIEASAGYTGVKAKISKPRPRPLSIIYGQYI